VVVCFGNRGSGKSTLLASLVYGPEALEEMTVKRPVNVNKIDGQSSRDKI